MPIPGILIVFDLLDLPDRDASEFVSGPERGQLPPSGDFGPSITRPAVVYKVYVFEMECI